MTVSVIVHSHMYYFVVGLDLCCLIVIYIDIDYVLYYMCKYVQLPVSYKFLLVQVVVTVSFISSTVLHRSSLIRVEYLSIVVLLMLITDLYRPYIMRIASVGLAFPVGIHRRT